MAKNLELSVKARNSDVTHGEARGFFPGMRHPGELIEMDLPSSKGVNFDHLDEKIKVVFDLEDIPKRKVKFRAKDGELEFAWRVLVVGSLLSHAINIPSFDPGIIMSVTLKQAKKPVQRFTALVPKTEFVPRKIHLAAYIHAIQLLQALRQNSDGRNSLEEVLDAIDQEYVKRYRGIIRGGASTIPLLNAAYSKGIPYRHLGHGIYKLGWGSRSKLVDRSSVVSDSAIGARLAGNKFLSARLLKEAGLPAPEHFAISTEKGALQAGASLGWPLVVKPVDRERGEGVTVDIDSDASLLEAFNRAKELSPTVLVERQVLGVCHRIFVANKAKILFVSKRLPKSVKGDGVHTVSELIESANRTEKLKAPWLRLKPFPHDEIATRSLAAAGLTFSDIPALDQYAPLRRIQSDAAGGVVEDRSDYMHPDNIDIALRAAELFGLDSAGIDLITDDISRPWHENGAILNEVNHASLLGGTAWRFKPKGYLSLFLEMTVDFNGRIPVEVFVGGEKARGAALARQKILYDDGIGCYLTTHSETCKPDGQPMSIRAVGLYGRTLSLLAYKKVDYLMLVVQTDEFLYTGLPIDVINSIHQVDSELLQWRDPDASTKQERYGQLILLLTAFATVSQNR